MKKQQAVSSVAPTVLALALIEVSKTNPRKTFDKAKMAELTDSVKTHGVLQPVLVRPFGEAKYELVAGERRYRAAQAAGLTEIPVVSRTLSDTEAQEIQVIENLQRDDLHPLEEAEAYEKLIAAGASEQSIADRIGKKLRYVYERLKLCALTPANRKRFYAGKLNPTTALLVARIPADLQDEAGREITYKNGEEPMSNTTATNHVHRVYMLELKRAPFPLGDETLVEGAGGCAACPKRTGNQKELFSDVKSGETCTDPKCYGAKREAFTARQIAEAEAKGQTVIVGEQAKKILPYDLSNGALGWVRLDSRCYDDQKDRTYRAILGKSAPMPALVQTDAGLIEVVRHSEIVDLLKQKGIKQREAQGGGTYQAKQKADEAKARGETAVRRAIHEALRAKVPSKLPHAAMLVVADAFYDRLEHENRKSVTRLWSTAPTGKKAPSVDEQSRVFDKVIAKMGPADLSKLLVDMATIRELNVGVHYRPELANVTTFCKSFKVDAGGVRKKMESALKAEQKAKAEAKAKSAKAKKAKSKKAAAAAPAIAA